MRPESVSMSHDFVLPKDLPSQITDLLSREEKSSDKPGIFREYGWKFVGIVASRLDSALEIGVEFVSAENGKVLFKILADKFADLPNDVGFQENDSASLAGWIYDYILEEIAFCDLSDKKTIILLDF